MRNFVLSVLLVMSAISWGSAQERVISERAIPEEILEFLSDYFSENKILQAVEETELSGKSHEILLSQHIKLEFNESNELEGIESVLELPVGIVPKKISNYIKANYQENVIIAWEMDEEKQQIELDNQLELEFDKNGEFLRIDID